MPAASLPRVRWSIGQVLLPEHFRALEGSLASEAARRVDFLGLPAYGIATLKWNGDDPKGGLLLIREIAVILPAGELIESPGNADIVGPLDLGKLNRHEVRVYIHVLDAPPPGEEIEGPSSPDRIAKSFYRIELSAEPTFPGSRGRVVLGSFVRRPGSGFSRAANPIPPLLLVGPHPYLQNELSALRADLESFVGTLGEFIAAEGAEGDPIRAAQRARIEALRMAALLEDMDQGIHPHPYTLFAALRGLLFELYLLDGSAPEGPLPRYDHEDLYGSFGEILRLVQRKLGLPPLRAPHILFERKEGRFIAEDLPPVLLAATEIYLMLRGPSPSQRPSIEGVRLASPTRLRAVHERSLRGVRIIPTPRPPIRHGFGPEAEFFRLQTEATDSPEWSHVVAERALCFYERPQLAGVEAALFWRGP